MGLEEREAVIGQIQIFGSAASGVGLLLIDFERVAA